MKQLFQHLFVVALLAPNLSFSAESFDVCTNYHCKTSQQVSLTTSQWQTLRNFFTIDQNARQERENIRKAIAYMEQEVGQVTGTWQDLGENYNGSDLPGQLDCISESRNTTTYLQLMQAANLLQYHTVQPRKRRAAWIFDVHWTAVIQEKATNELFAVDSWYLDNGQPPYIQPLAQWLRKMPFDESTD